MSNQTPEDQPPFGPISKWTPYINILEEEMFGEQNKNLEEDEEPESFTPTGRHRIRKAFKRIFAAEREATATRERALQAEVARLNKLLNQCAELFKQHAYPAAAREDADTTEFHRLYTQLHSALVDVSNSVGDVLVDIPAEPRYDTYRLLWARLDKSIDDTMGRLQALEAHDARALAER